MYLINKYGSLQNIVLKHVIQTKHTSLRKRKQSVVFVRAPKHFNIGKHKIHALKTTYFRAVFTKKLLNSSLIFNPNLLFNFISNLYISNYLINIYSAWIK